MAVRALAGVWWRSPLGELALTPADVDGTAARTALSTEVTAVAASRGSALRWDDAAPSEGLAALTLDDRATLRARAAEGCEVEVPDGATVVRWEPGVATVSFAGRIGESWVALRRGDRTERLALHVESPLLRGRAAHRAMIDDLLAESFARALVDDGPSLTALAHRRDRGAAQRVLVAWLLRSGTLHRALSLVARSPLRRVEATGRVVPWASARRVRVEELAANPSFARGDDASRTLVRAQEPALSVDTPENRAVASLLRTVSAALTEPPPPASLVEALQDAMALADRIGLRGLPASVTASTLAESRHAGYRELAAARRWLEGLAVATDPYDPAVHLALDDSALLYERWCAREVSRALGLDATVAPGEGADCVLGGRRVRLWSQPGRAAAPSYGLAYRPDLVVEEGGARLVFDAKFRADVAGSVEKMHAYRDAIAGCVAAWALMPCADDEAVDHPAADGGGVGVVALRPGDGDGEERRRAIRARVLATLGGVRRRSRGPAGRPG